MVKRQTRQIGPCPPKVYLLERRWSITTREAVRIIRSSASQRKLKRIEERVTEQATLGKDRETSDT